MKFVCVFLTFFYLSLGAEEFTHLKSDKVRSASQTMIMDGNVILRGEKGEIRADHASIPFSRTGGVLTGNVEMRFPLGEVLVCDRAELDLDNQNLDFIDQVAFRNRDGMILQADQMSVKFHHEQEGGCQDVQFIEARGNVKLLYHDEWELASNSARYDKEENKVAFLVDPVGDSAVFFHDVKGKMYAKSAVFDLSSKQCILEGDVRMIQREGPLEQYAIAEKVILLKEENAARFFSKNGGKVLFYDRVNRLQISAPEIYMVKDPINNKDSVKGVGKVRFHFKDEEYERLRQYFMLEKLNG